MIICEIGVNLGGESFGSVEDVGGEIEREIVVAGLWMQLISDTLANSTK